VVTSPIAGELMATRDADGVAAAVRLLLSRPADRAATRAYAEGFSWGETTAGQIELFRSIVNSQSRLKPIYRPAIRADHA